MQVPVLGATATDRAERPVAHPFVLSRPHGTVVAEGVNEHFDRASAAADACAPDRSPHSSEHCPSHPTDRPH